MPLNRVGAGAVRPALPEWTPRESGRGTRTEVARRPATLDEPPLGEAPPGTDPELWSALTAEERAFFARIGALGPLTYGRTAEANGPPVFRGLHLDVIV